MKIYKSFLLLCIFLSACGYEGKEECERYFQARTYKYKETCECVKEKAENNGVVNFKEFINIFSDKKKAKELVRMAAASVFGGNVGKQSESYIKTMTDAASFCRIDDPEITECIVCQDKFVYVTEYKGHRLVFTEQEQEKWLKEIKKYLYDGSTFEGLVKLVTKNTKNVYFDEWKKSDKILNDWMTLEKKIEGSLRQANMADFIERFNAWAFSSFNEEFAKVYRYYREVEGYEEQDAADLAYGNATYLVFKAFLNLNNNAYIPSRNDFYKNHSEYKSFKPVELYNNILKNPYNIEDKVKDKNK